MKKILIATNNSDKVLEIKKALDMDSVQFLSLKDEGINIEVVEDGDTLEANAQKKAKEVFLLTGIPSAADDTGLFVDALNGEPGVYSSRYAGENVTYADNRNKLITRMESVPDDKRNAEFRTVLCYYYEKNKYIMFEGICNGKIIRAPRGDADFGFDPVFVPDGYEKTFAEMDLDLKNQISHRGKALQKFKDYLISHH